MIIANETAKEAARRLSIDAISAGFKPEALHEYTDQEGNILYWRILLVQTMAKPGRITPRRMA